MMAAKQQIFAICVFCVVFTVVECQYEDVRCKCVCPALPSQNGTDKQNVFAVYFEEPHSCVCKNVVEIPPENPNYCDTCECKWQRRNTTTMKVVVILVICVVSLLVLYMLFLLCLDPLMSRRPKTYLEQHNEEVNLGPQDTQSVTQRMEDDGTTRARHGPIISRVQHQVNRAKGEQQKWKGTVQEQRRNVYDRHNMLN